MHGKTVIFVLMAGLLMLSVPALSGPPASTSGTITATARVEDPIGLLNTSNLETSLSLLKAPASSELQIKIDYNNLSDIFICNASTLTTDDWPAIISNSTNISLRENSGDDTIPAVITITIVGQ